MYSVSHRSRDTASIIYEILVINKSCIYIYRPKSILAQGSILLSFILNLYMNTIEKNRKVNNVHQYQRISLIDQQKSSFNYLDLLSLLDV